MTLNPGHFHAALVQKEMLGQVDPMVYVYAPAGPDLDLHLERIQGFNTRPDNPTGWEIITYTGPDYLDRMLVDRPGNVIVMAGNNQLKTQYIKRAVDNAIHVLSDKPMAIDRAGWALLVSAFESADQHDVLLYDIMTERSEVTSRLMRALSQREDLFGRLETGSPEDPAITLESVHHLFKHVAGSPLRRPPWYFDVAQQGEGVVDVTTHLVDLAMWTAFPDEIIHHEQDVEMIAAKRWPTMVTRGQFDSITGQSKFPDYLQGQLEANSVLPLYCNGEMLYRLKGSYVRIKVQWNYEAPQGGDDTHQSVMRGTNAKLIVRQGAEQDFVRTLYVEPAEGTNREALEAAVERAVEDLQAEFPGIDAIEREGGWQFDIPRALHLGHEAHFSLVADRFFSYLIDGDLPAWEIPNMITKYFITTEARERALASSEPAIAAVR